MDFHRLVAGASEAELRRRSDGTRWTNKELLFHMVLGYLILRALRRLILLFGGGGYRRERAGRMRGC